LEIKTLRFRTKCHIFEFLTVKFIEDQSEEMLTRPGKNTSHISVDNYKVVRLLIIISRLFK